jgi:hypothetical protein
MTSNQNWLTVIYGNRAIQKCLIAANQQRHGAYAITSGSININKPILFPPLNFGKRCALRQRGELSIHNQVIVGSG